MKRRDLLIGGGALALAGSAEAACRTDRRDRRVNRLRGDCGDSGGVPALPSGPIIALEAADVAGANMADVTTWDNTGTIADFTQAAAISYPKLLVNSAERAVNFDGVFDLLTSAGSAAATGFVMSTGVFDLILCLRRTNTTVGQERRICGNCEGQAGLFVAFNTDANTDGTFWIILSNGVGLLTNYRSTARAPLGEPYKVLIRGDGTQLRISTNFSTFEDTAFAAALGSGDAFYDWSLGGADPSQTTPKTLEADVYAHYLYNRNLSVSELAAVQARLTAQVGAGI